MKTYHLQMPKFFTYLTIFVLILSISSCSNSNYTASFQKVPSTNYAQNKKAPAQEAVQSSSEIVAANLEIAEVIEEDVLQEISENLTASLKEMGVSEKKSAKIQKRLETLNESLANAKTETNTPARNLNFAEKMMVKKAMKKADKILNENNIKDINNLDETQQRTGRGNIYLGLVLILAGIIVAVLVPGAGAWIGSIAAAIGLILLIVGLLA
ncbi:hypothetical protein BH23BAC1_BH23BAC1_34560 [soil metagenome]